jgi:hypothetical protein
MNASLLRVASCRSRSAICFFGLGDLLIPAAIGWLSRRGVSRLAARFVTPKLAAPAQLDAVQSPHPQVRPAMPGSASVSRGTLLRVTHL